MKSLNTLKIKLFADGADLEGMLEMYKLPHIAGFTTNPTLMRQSGITDYTAFAQEVLQHIPDRPISFEVFADEPDEMLDQAKTIASWGSNVNVKIPIMNTKGDSTVPVIRQLSDSGIIVNVTAIMTLKQVEEVATALTHHTPAIVSVFAGRIADTGIDPIPHMKKCADALAHLPKSELLWASPREVLNVIQAEQSGCHIITATNDLLKKVALFGKDLHQYSKETVEMFYKDASASGYSI